MNSKLEKKLQIGDVLVCILSKDISLRDDIFVGSDLRLNPYITCVSDEIEITIVKMIVSCANSQVKDDIKPIDILSLGYFNSISWRNWCSRKNKDVIKRFYISLLNIFSSDIYEGFFNSIKDRNNCSIDISFSHSYLQIIDYTAKRCLIIMYFINLTGRISLCYNNATIKSTLSCILLHIYSKMLIHSLGGTLLHGASVAIENEGYIFLGKSGSGKSTIASHLVDHTILSDDITIVRKKGDKYFLFYSPWWNKEGVLYSKMKCGIDACIELKKIFFLKKDLKTSLRKLEINDALENSETQMYLLENELSMANHMFFLYRLFRNIGTYELCFKKNGEFRGFLTQY